MNIETIISSKAKLLCLKAIHSNGKPIHLRRLVNLTNLQPRSVQLALDFLKTAGILKYRQRSNRVEYFLNEDFSNVVELRSFLEMLKFSEIEKRKSNYQDLNASFIFIEDARNLIKTLKANRSNVIN